MSEVDVYAVFGLEAPTQEPQTDPAGEQEQEVAAPADTGEQEQEVAAPDTSAADDPEQEDTAQEQPAEKQPLTKAQKAENARQRREQEKMQAANAAREAERKANETRFNAFLAKIGLTDPYNGGKAITTMEEAEAYINAHQTANLQKNLKSGKLTQEDLQTMIEQSPTMIRAREIAEKADAEAKASQDARFAQQVETELAEIRKMDPTVQTLHDIIRMPTGQKFSELVQKNGLSYVDAFRLANADRLQQQAAQAAAAGAKVSAGGKDHLTRTGVRGKGAADVSREQAAAYRVFQPNLTDDQIQRDYQKYVKK
jgi:arsenate reductase-like glutaredoxin family protein